MDVEIRSLSFKDAEVAGGVKVHAQYLFNTCRRQSELRSPVDLTGVVKCKKNREVF
jgi:hypothetical protein